MTIATRTHQPENPLLVRSIQISLLIIVALMPFHAFLSVWLGSITHHQAIIQAWKEALLGLTSLVTIVLGIRDRKRLNRLHQPWVLAAGAFALIAGLVTLIAQPPLTAIAFGLKTDLEFILAGVLALMVSTPKFHQRLVIAVLVGAALVTGFDIIQIFLLPPDFLTHFGYGPDTIVPFQRIAAGTNALRFPSTLGGPNQLGTYLILPLCLSLLIAIRRRRPWLLVLTAACAISLFYTFSRAAWLGALLALCCTGFALVPSRFKKHLVLALGATAVAALLALPIALKPNGALQYFLLHSSVATHDQSNLSDSQHLSSLKYGVTADTQTPLGHGLGTAGPATFHASSTNIIEDYYLQIGYETGLLGLLAFVVMIVLLLKTLLAQAASHLLASASAAAILGISLAALVLPAWTDSSTALIVLICAGATAGASLKPDYV